MYPNAIGPGHFNVILTVHFSVLGMAGLFNFTVS